MQKAFVCVLVMALAMLAAAKKPSHVVWEMSSNTTYYSVLPSLEIVSGKQSGALAWGFNEPSMNETGWDVMSITTNPEFSDEAVMFGAGYLEAYLTQEGIWQYYVNSYGTGELNPKLAAFMEENWEWTAMMVNASAQYDPYWLHVGLVQEQFKGLYAGYSAYAGADQALDFWQVLALTANGDVETLTAGVLTGVNPEKSTRYGSHCSAMIKLTEDFEELYIGHTTWDNFGFQRIYKQYTFDLDAPGTSAQSWTASSYPAVLLSVDDYYTTDQKLAIVETTNGCYNTSMYQFITPTSGVFSWIRTIVANRMASTGEEWMRFFGTANSGTYNNAWMVIDYKLFVPGEDLQEGLFWYGEQLPGKMFTEDMTDVLGTAGYWGSYNVPFFAENRELCGFPAQEAKFGPYLFSPMLCARAKIFRRNQTSVQSNTDFQKILRYNDYQNDPFSEGPGGVPNAGLSISSRFDLVKETYPNNPSLSRACFGSIDGKQTSNKLMQMSPAGASWAQSGPTHDQQPVFKWSDWASVSSLGQPREYDFGWIFFEF